MFTILNRVLVIFSIFMAPQLTWAESSCVEGKIRSSYFSNMKTIKASYCYNLQKTELSSRKCVYGRCVNKNLFLKIMSDELISEYGSPGFALCRKLGGTGEIVNFLANSNWFALDRCLFSDGEFIDTGTLFKLFKENKN